MIISCQALKSFIYSAVILFVMLASCHLLSPSLIFQDSVYSRGTRYPPHVSFVTTSQGSNVPRTYLLHEESVTWKIMTSSVKAKIWKWLTAVAVAKKNQFRFSIPIPIPGFSIPIPGFSIPPISIPIPIPELELELTCNSNSGIELTPTLVPKKFCFPACDNWRHVMG